MHHLKSEIADQSCLNESIKQACSPITITSEPANRMVASAVAGFTAKSFSSVWQTTITTPVGITSAPADSRRWFVLLHISKRGKNKHQKKQPPPSGLARRCMRRFWSQKNLPAPIARMQVAGAASHGKYLRPNARQWKY